MQNMLANRYRLIERVGVGGMAYVYRAYDTHTGHDVAIKVLKPEYNQDGDFIVRFQHEALAARKMTHHNIVNLLDVGMDGGNRYLVMEYVQGKTLKDMIREKGRIPYTQTIEITIRILGALQHAHQNQIIHRDIKPQNILISNAGNVKVADFGIARMADTPTLTHENSVMGTVHYFSPEQASGAPVEATSDLYSVGVVLYEMLTGRVPFDGENGVAIAMQHLKNKPVPIEQYAPQVPRPLCAVCMKAMEKNPKNRYQSATEMASDLNHVLHGRYQRLSCRQTTAAEHVVTNGTGQKKAVAKTNSVSKPVQKQEKRVKGQRLRMLFTAAITLAVCYALYVGTVQIYDQVINSTTVPVFTGLPLEQAEVDATRAELRISTVHVNSTSPAGTVISQSPGKGTGTRKGDTVVLTVSDGPSPTSVPNILNSTVETAAAILQPYGLTITVIERVASADLPVGTILSQKPQPGSDCRSGGIVQVTVSGGHAVVPTLTGRTLAEAKQLLVDAKLTLGALQYTETNDPTLHGIIALQSPAASGEVIEGATVSLTLYRDPNQTHTAQITLKLPERQQDISIRVTVLNENVETVLYAGIVSPDMTRYPVMDISMENAGNYIVRVYVDDEFRYQQTVEIK